MKAYTISIKALDGSQIEIAGELQWDTFSTFESKALKHITEHLELPGFRKGNVPEDIARKQVGDAAILGEMAELAVQEYYPIIITEEKIDAIGRPEVAITKLARDNSLGFTITTAVLPEIKLPNYKKLAAGIPSEETRNPEDSDIDNVINDLRQIRAYGHVHAATDNHQHTEELPEVNDEFAQSFGVETVAAMREKVRENLISEKTQELRDKRRIGIMDAIVAETSFTVPELIIMSEQDKMFAQIESDISRSGMTMEDYLKHANKTRDALLEEFKPEAERRGRFQLLVNAIARDAQISASDEEVEIETQKLLQAYPGADKNRTQAYADMVLTNEKVFTLLEGK